MSIHLLEPVGTSRPSVSPWKLGSTDSGVRASGLPSSGTPEHLQTSAPVQFKRPQRGHFVLLINFSGGI
jgi:hypothetical protein